MAGERERLMSDLSQVAIALNVPAHRWKSQNVRKAIYLLEADAAELAALRKDAERYRLIRDSKCVYITMSMHGDKHDGKIFLTIDEDAIDAALATPRNEAKDKGEGV